MDERRRLRIQVRRGVAAAAAAPEARLLTSPEKGATPRAAVRKVEDEDDSFSPEDDVDFDDDVVDVGVSVDLDGDEFDP
jgi:nucleoid-associated protein YgaU